MHPGSWPLGNFSCHFSTTALISFSPLPRASSVPITYTIDPERRLVSSSASGHVTAAEILDHQDRLMRDPDFDPAFRQLVDFSGATNISASSADIRVIATRNFFGQGARRCIVAPTAEIFGLARMFQTFRELSGGEEEIQIFKDRNEALQWLFAEPSNNC